MASWRRDVGDLMSVDLDHDYVWVMGIVRLEHEGGNAVVGDRLSPSGSTDREEGVLIVGLADRRDKLASFKKEDAGPGGASGRRNTAATTKEPH
jgi:hypothetical protein